MQRAPKARPTASQALWQFENIVSQQRGLNLRWHLQQSSESVGQRVALNVYSTAREMLFILKKVSGETEVVLIQHRTQPVNPSSIATPFVLGMSFLAASRSLLSVLHSRRSVFSRLFGSLPSDPPEPSP